MSQLTSVPSWATAMIGNYRNAAEIPANISDLEIYKAIKSGDIELFNEEADKLLMLRNELDLDTEGCEV